MPIQTQRRVEEAQRLAKPTTHEGRSLLKARLWLPVRCWILGSFGLSLKAVRHPMRSLVRRRKANAAQGRDRAEPPLVAVADVVAQQPMTTIRLTMLLFKPPSATATERRRMTAAL